MHQCHGFYGFLPTTFSYKFTIYLTAFLTRTHGYVCPHWLRCLPFWMYSHADINTRLRIVLCTTAVHRFHARGLFLYETLLHVCCARRTRSYAYGSHLFSRRGFLFSYGTLPLDFTATRFSARTHRTCTPALTGLHRLVLRYLPAHRTTRTLLHCAGFKVRTYTCRAHLGRLHLRARATHPHARTHLLHRTGLHTRTHTHAVRHKVFHRDTVRAICLYTAPGLWITLFCRSPSFAPSSHASRTYAGCLSQPFRHFHASPPRTHLFTSGFALHSCCLVCRRRTSPAPLLALRTFVHATSLGLCAPAARATAVCTLPPYIWFFRLTPPLHSFSFAFRFAHHHALFTRLFRFYSRVLTFTVCTTFAHHSFLVFSSFGCVHALPAQPSVTHLCHFLYRHLSPLPRTATVVGPPFLSFSPAAHTPRYRTLRTALALHLGADHRVSLLSADSPAFCDVRFSVAPCRAHASRTTVSARACTEDISLCTPAFCALTALHLFACRFTGHLPAAAVRTVLVALTARRAALLDTPRRRIYSRHRGLLPHHTLAYVFSLPPHSCRTVGLATWFAVCRSFSRSDSGLYTVISLPLRSLHLSSTWT